MDHLTEDQRITFVLSEVEERSSAEVAEILKVPSSTVRARVSAAREKLREILAAEAEP
jgi:RNA polymerase sigma-70 factor (ECF subfamily)